MSGGCGLGSEEGAPGRVPGAVVRGSRGACQGVVGKGGVMWGRAHIRPPAEAGLPGLMGFRATADPQETLGGLVATKHMQWGPGSWQREAVRWPCPQGLCPCGDGQRPPERWPSGEAAHSSSAVSWRVDLASRGRVVQGSGMFLWAGLSCGIARPWGEGVCRGRWSRSAGTVQRMKPLACPVGTHLCGWALWLMAGYCHIPLSSAGT